MSSRTITTEATGQREKRPELAVIEVAAAGEGDSTAVARAAARDRAAMIRESVTVVSTDRVRTPDICVEDSDELFGPETDARYRAEEQLHVDCVPESVEAVVQEVTDAGGTVQEVQFELHDDARRQLQNGALRAAMDRAREKAERIAATEGLVLGEVRNVTNTAVSGVDDIFDESFGSDSDTDLHPTPIAVSERVEVVYELSEK